MVGLILGCCLVIVGEGSGSGYPVTIGMVEEVEVDLVELLIDGWELCATMGNAIKGEIIDNLF
jgi:hypothetical protein